MATSFDPVVSPTVVSSALKTLSVASEKLVKVKAVIAAAQSKAFNMVLDAMLIACDKPKPVFMKGNAATNPARAQVKAMFEDAVKAGHLEGSTAKTYQNCFWIAFETGVPWSANLANEKSAAKKAAEGEAKANPKAAGGVQSTSRKDLDKTLSKALAQARLLGLTEFAAELVDLCIDRLDGFTETVLDK